MNSHVKNHGFIAPVITPDNFIAGDGNLPHEVLQPDGDWSAYAPMKEPQMKNGIETCNCTCFSTNNAIEALHKRKFGVEENHSDRFPGICAGTRPPGNSPHVLAEAIREHGQIPEAMLPFSDDIKAIEDYYSFKGANEDECRRVGKLWRKQWDFGHDWVPTTPFMLKKYLQASPLGVSVYAWEKGENGLYYKPEGAQDNHWACLIGYKQGEYWLVFDNYEDDGSPIKKLAWDYKFDFAKRYWVNKVTVVEKPSLWVRILAYLTGKKYGIMRATTE